MNQLQFGDILVDRLIEDEGLGFDPFFFFPDSTEEGWELEKDWLMPRFLDAETGRMIRAIQSYVIRTDHHTILVDACVGNDKERPSTPVWNNMQTPWLANFRALGVDPAEVDFVLCTHLHADHVGWNTQLVDGRWVPTFPNAKYIFHRDEYAFWEENGDAIEGPGSADGCFEDSVLPVMEADQAELVGGDYQIDDRLTLEPMAGHSPGHVVLNLNAAGRLMRREEQAVAPFVYASIHITHPRLFVDCPPGAFSLVRLWDRAQEAGRLHGVRHDGTWYHVGSPDGLRAVEEALTED